MQKLQQKKDIIRRNIYIPSVIRDHLFETRETSCLNLRNQAVSVHFVSSHRFLSSCEANC